MGLDIHLLGPPRVERDGRTLGAPRGRKAWGLLAYLVCRQAATSRAHVAALLFEEADDPLGALRWNLSQLRRLLGDVIRGDSLELSLDPSTTIDIRTLAEGSWEDVARMPGLDGELLEGLSFATSPSFDVWLGAERRRLRACAEAVLREAALSRLGAGAAREAADLAARLVRQNPLDENFQALLVRCLSASGDGIGAARQAAACRDLFRRELGVEPGAALQAAMATTTASPITRPTTGRAAALAQLDAGEAAIGAGALEAGLQCLRRAIVEADATRDAVLRTRARVALGGALVHAARGRDEEGATALHEALVVGQGASAPLAASACRELGYVEFLRGRYARALAWLRRADSLAGDDPLECAGIAAVRGSVLSDTAHYTDAIAALRQAEALAEGAGDVRQLAYALSMRGRVLLLREQFSSACDVLDQAVALAQQGWMAFVPWPQSLRAEVDLNQGEVDAAAARLEHAFALGCQLGDPCWEGISARGLGRVAIARDDPAGAARILVDAVARGARLPDAYLWGKGYALDVLCGLAVARRMPEAAGWIAELQALAARSGMRELVVRAHVHRCALEPGSSMATARLLAREVDNEALQRVVTEHVGKTSGERVVDGTPGRSRSGLV